MTVSSPIRVKTSIRHEIDVHPASSLCAIIGPPLSGVEYVLDDLYDSYSSQPRTLAFKVDAREFLNPECLYGKLADFVGESMDCHDVQLAKGMPFGDSLFAVLNSIEHADDCRIIFLFYGMDELEPSKQYGLAGQLRNLREKTKTEMSALRVHTICGGTWSVIGMAEESKKMMGSFPFDKCSWLGKLTLDELSEICGASSTANRADELFVQYLHELSKGCFGVVHGVLERVGTDLTCANILKAMDALATSQPFLDELRRAASSLSTHHISLLSDLLGGQFLLWRENDPMLETMYISGLVAVESKLGVEVATLRSWAHETALRKYARGLFPSLRVYTCCDELIPPTYAINQRAFVLIMEIENHLRNLLVLRASIQHPNQNAFVWLDKLGNVIEFEKGKPRTIREHAQQRRQILQETKMIDTHTSLSSYLDLGNIYALFTDQAVVAETGMRVGIYDLLTDIFPDRSQLEGLLRKIRDIRNPVAHNNLISEATVRELEQAAKNLAKHLAKPSSS
jgi:hypothetical protein